MEKIPYLIETLPYIQKLRGSTFVIKLSGSVVKDQEALITGLSVLSIVLLLLLILVAVMKRRG
jgi:hypothetical protein